MLIIVSGMFSSVQSLSHARLCDAMDSSIQASLSITNSQSSLRLMSVELVIGSAARSQEERENQEA